MNVATLITEISWDLNDPNFVTWSQAQIRAYISDALGIIYTNNPGDFTVRKVVKLTPCTEIQDTCGCDEIRRVIGQSTEDGRVISTLRVRTADDKLKWPGKSCTSKTFTGQFLLSDYTIDSVTGTLSVYPAPPPGKPIYLLIECAEAPSGVSDSTAIQSKHVAAVRQYVLYCCKTVDGETSSYVLQAAKMHETEFWKLVIAESLTSKKYLVDSKDTSAAQVQSQQAQAGS